MSPQDTTLVKESSKHTPGPWSTAMNYRDKLAVVGPANDGRTTNADRICNLPHRPDGRGLANARLIAAAPDLLAACKLAWFAFRVPEGTRIKDERKALELMRLAIAKAEGRG